MEADCRILKGAIKLEEFVHQLVTYLKTRDIKVILTETKIQNKVYLTVIADNLLHCHVSGRKLVRRKTVTTFTRNQF